MAAIVVTTLDIRRRYDSIYGRAGKDSIDLVAGVNEEGF